VQGSTWRSRPAPSGAVVTASWQELRRRLPGSGATVSCKAATGSARRSIAVQLALVLVCAAGAPLASHEATCCTESAVSKADFRLIAAVSTAPACDRAPRSGLQVNSTSVRIKSWCHIDGCGRRSSYAESGGTHFFCRQHRNSSHARIYRSRSTTLRCRAEACGKQPNFGCKSGKALYCGMHKQAHHVNVNRRVCTAEGCTRTRCFGEEVLPDGGSQDGRERSGSVKKAGQRRRRGLALFCRAHSNATHVNVQAYLCSYPGCDRMGSAGNSSVGHMCSKHRLLLPASRRCKHPEGCEGAAFFGSSADRLPIYCISHKRSSHVNCMVRACAHVEGCRKQPSFGGHNDTVPRFCSSHREEWHVDLKHDRCAYLGCRRVVNPHRDLGRRAQARATGVAARGTHDSRRTETEDEIETRFLCKQHADMMTRIRPPLRPTLERKKKRRT